METKNQTYTPFVTELSCFSFLCSTDSEVTQRLKYTNKILLPESVLYSLRENDKLEFPLFFKVYNTQTKYGHVCGVEEFTAPPGVCHVPYQLMADISVNEGDTIGIELMNVPEGDFVKLRFHKSDFSKLSNPKVIMEKIMSSDYPVLTKGQTIVLYYKEIDKTYHVDIVDTKPTEVIKIINTNLNVDFDKALDYKEDEPPCPSVTPSFVTPPTRNVVQSVVRDVSGNLKKFKNTGDFAPFSGTGYRLGSS